MCGQHPAEWDSMGTGMPWPLAHPCGAHSTGRCPSPSRCPMGCSAPRGVPRASCPFTPSWSLHPGVSPCCPPPCTPPLARKPPTAEAAGRKEVAEGVFLTLIFARSLPAATYAGQEPRPKGTALPRSHTRGRCPGVPARPPARQQVPHRHGEGPWGPASAVGHRRGAESPLPTPGGDARQGHTALGWLARRSGRGAGWGGWVYPAMCLSFPFILPRRD